MSHYFNKKQDVGMMVNFTLFLATVGLIVGVFLSMGVIKAEEQLNRFKVQDMRGAAKFHAHAWLGARD